MNLTPTEQLYFEALKKDQSEAGVSRSTLHALQPPNNQRVSNVVDVHIKNLRAKLRKEGYDIVSVRGFGYKLVKDGQE